MSGRKSWSTRRPGARSPLRMTGGWPPPAEHAVVPLRALRPVALRARLHGVRFAARPGTGKSQAATPSTCRCDAVRRGWLPFFPQFNRSSLALAREAAAQRRNERWRDYPVRGRPAQDRQARLCGGRPRRAGELAAGLVHLARQCHRHERQGPRVLSAPLPGHAQQRHRAGDGRGRYDRGRPIAPRRRPASWTWSSI